MFLVVWCFWCLWCFWYLWRCWCFWLFGAFGAFGAFEPWWLFGFCCNVICVLCCWWFGGCCLVCCLVCLKFYTLKINSSFVNCKNKYPDDLRYCVFNCPMYGNQTYNRLIYSYDCLTDAYYIFQTSSRLLKNRIKSLLSLSYLFWILDLKICVKQLFTCKHNYPSYFIYLVLC